MMFKRQRATVRSTALSDFIRNASSQEKKRVYAIVLEKSTQKQNRLIGRRYPAVSSPRD
jgi:hypothetical protein